MKKLKLILLINIYLSKNFNTQIITNFGPISISTDTAAIQANHYINFGRIYDNNTDYTINIGTDNSSGSINIGTGTNTGDINIGTGSNAGTVTIGRSGGTITFGRTPSFTDLTATGTISLNGTTSGTTTIGNSTNGGNVNIKSSSTNAVNINVDTGAATVTNIGTGSTYGNINIGNCDGTHATQMFVNINTGTKQVAGTFAKTIIGNYADSGSNEVQINAHDSNITITTGTDEAAASAKIILQTLKVQGGTGGAVAGSQNIEMTTNPETSSGATATGVIKLTTAATKQNTTNTGAGNIELTTTGSSGSSGTADIKLTAGGTGKVIAKATGTNSVDINVDTAAATITNIGTGTTTGAINIGATGTSLATARNIAVNINTANITQPAAIGTGCTTTIGNFSDGGSGALNLYSHDSNLTIKTGNDENVAGGKILIQTVLAASPGGAAAGAQNIELTATPEITSGTNATGVIKLTTTATKASVTNSGAGNIELTTAGNATAASGAGDIKLTAGGLGKVIARATGTSSVNINVDTAAATVTNIGTGTTTGAINIGNTTNCGAVSLLTKGSSVSIQAVDVTTGTPSVAYGEILLTTTAATVAAPIADSGNIELTTTPNNNASNSTIATGKIKLSTTAITNSSGAASGNIEITTGGKSATTGMGDIKILAGNSGAIFLAGNGISTSGTNGLQIDNTGKVTTVPSSIKYKENIEEIIISKEDFAKLKPVSFLYKEKERNYKNYKHFGLIAEDLLNTPLECAIIFGNNEIPYSINYTSIFIALLKRFLEAQKEIDSSKKLIKKIIKEFLNLKNKNNELEEKIDNLYKKIIL